MVQELEEISEGYPFVRWDMSHASKGGVAAHKPCEAQ